MNQGEDLFSSDGFAVDLDVFSGPFEVLLSLITRRKLDITEVALAEVTDEFLAFVRAQDEADLSQMSEFVVVAATLLDMKAARLLPREESEEEDLELLGARDLLFAKLLQYKAYKDVATDLAAALGAQSLSYPRDVPMEEVFRRMLPEVELRQTVDDLAQLAAKALTRVPDQVALDHLHDPLIPVETQVSYLREKLVVGDRVSFTELCRDARSVSMVVSRFLAVLEMLRGGEVDIHQDGPLSALFVIRITHEIPTRAVDEDEWGSAPASEALPPTDADRSEDKQ
ncbi:segregation and condensation protein A [Trueperella pyogenes]|uniref:Segregation and condensation protein A n=1 Tax=Trueperella pyogenes TaxID=1661 RepID=A0A3Q9GES9_9ACTO|nr:ScpA family protein [Trueperella pyogenes]AWG04642.1 segregation/condensation protein A [Trueperella pyogenes]AWG15469.1 segregation/condensation protein A [Trueperella pyogenes]AZR04356.1 segregation/condensation protein A [Trueperella pyogenes]AZR06077.1 segregation/condensation protein A [Trueperella pyogenes]MCI7689112.1 segregation/condensation protein A [Trueperella pyogenes]